MRAKDVEQASRPAIELVVLWRGDVLSVSHFSAPGSVVVGAGGDCDIALPAELLGAERRCVAVSSSGNVCAVLPRGVRGWLTLPGGSTRSIDERTSALGPSERLLPLPVDYRAHLCFAHLELQVATVCPGHPCPRTLGVDASVLVSFGLCTLTMASIMAVFSCLAPARGLNQDEREANAQLGLLRTYLTAAAERAPEPRTEGDRESLRAATAKSLAWRSASREATSEATDIETERVAVVGSTLGPDGDALLAPDPVGRRSQIRRARKYGMIGLLDWPELNDPKLKFGRHMSGEELALMDMLFKPEFTPLSEAAGGLTLSGIGIGGGGEANVIALNAVRTIDKGQGDGLDRLPGGRSLRNTHTSQAPSFEPRESIISDPLTAASIRSAVHAERAALRACYANGLGSGSRTATSTLVRFVVLGNGRIEQVRTLDAALPENVSRCIERVFLGLSVPNPVFRPVHVAYRVALDS